MSGDVVVERDGAVWSFTLNAPQRRNALSSAMVEALLQGVTEAHAQGARVLAFRGAGRNFSAGFDFTDVEAQSEGDLLLRFVRIETLLQAVAGSPCVTLALAHGRNFGAGVDLFAVCRQRLATPDASFRMPGLKFGLVLGTRRFADIVGTARAQAILETASSFDTDAALAMGFVQRTVATGGDADWAEALASARQTAESLDPESRRALQDALASSNGDAELAALVRSAGRPGLKERIDAYRSDRG